MMAPALPPALVGQEAAACALLGLVLGSVRAVFPVRGRAAFLPDMALVGAVLLGLQSYAAALSGRGRAAVVYARQRLPLCFWGRTASAACPAQWNRGCSGWRRGCSGWPGGHCSRWQQPAKTGWSSRQSTPRAKKKLQKNRKRTCQHTAVCCIIQTYQSKSTDAFGPAVEHGGTEKWQIRPGESGKERHPSCVLDDLRAVRSVCCC